jgi:hypothetical protein
MQRTNPIEEEAASTAKEHPAERNAAKRLDMTHLAPARAVF